MEMKNKTKEVSIESVPEEERLSFCMKNVIEIANETESEKPTKIFGEIVPEPKIGAGVLYGNTLYCAARSGFRIGDHAEFTVLQTMLPDKDLSNAILFTTLEPCTPESRSPWTSCCCDLIAERKIKKVFVGSIDCNPLVTGKGILHLQEHGVDVQFFDLENAKLAAELNDEFFKYFKRGIDVKAFKKINSDVHPFVDPIAVELYLRCKDGDDIDYNKISEPTVEEYFLFYSEMMRDGYITYNSIDKTVDVDNAFIICFYKKPSEFVHSFKFKFQIKARNNDNPNNYEIDCPLAISLNEMINGQSRRNIFHRIFDELRKISDSKTRYPDVPLAQLYHLLRTSIKIDLKKLREIVINSAVHSLIDKRTNCQGVTINIKEDEISILNLLNTSDFSTAKNYCEKLNKGTVPSLPVNPALMDLLKTLRITEGMHIGMDQVSQSKNTNKITYDVEEFLDKIVLITKIEFEK